MIGKIDNIKIRVRTHNPKNIEEIECNNIDKAIQFLNSLR